MKKILFILLIAPFMSYGQNFLENAPAGAPNEASYFDGLSAVTDGYRGWYVYNPNSSQTADTMNWYQPVTVIGNGRWVRSPIEIIPPISITSTTTSTLIAKETIYNINATSGNITLTLTAGWQYQKVYVRRTDATSNTVNIAITSNLINGQSSVSLPDQDRVYTIFIFYGNCFIL